MKRRILVSAIVPLLLVGAAAFAQTDPSGTGYGTGTHGVGPVGGMSVEDWYGYVCGDNGAVFKWVARGTMGIAGASVIANFKTITALPVIGPIVNFFALNWRTLADVLVKGATPK